MSIIKQPKQLILFFIYTLLFVVIIPSAMDFIFTKFLNVPLPFDSSLFLVTIIIFLPNLARAFVEKDSVPNLLITFAGSLLIMILLIIGFSIGSQEIGIAKIDIASPEATIWLDFRFILLLFFISFLIKSAKLFIEYKIKHSD